MLFYSCGPLHFSLYTTLQSPREEAVEEKEVVQQKRMEVEPVHSSGGEHTEGGAVPPLPD